MLPFLHLIPSQLTLHSFSRKETYKIELLRLLCFIWYFFISNRLVLIRHLQLFPRFLLLLKTVQIKSQSFPVLSPGKCHQIFDILLFSLYLFSCVFISKFGWLVESLIDPTYINNPNYI